MSKVRLNCRELIRVTGARIAMLLLAGAGVGPASSGLAGAAEPSALEAASAIETVLADAIARAEKSVVAITRVPKNAEGKPDDPEFIPNDFMTGVVIDQQGFILTTFHALGDPRENEYRVWINRLPYQAELLEVEGVQGGDPWTDLAVLKIKPGGAKLSPIVLGDATNLKKGRIVVALGDPYAIVRDGQVGASWGMISNLQRRADADPRADKQALGAPTLHHYGTLIQTDAKLQFNTSGGPLINLQGEMIGLTTTLSTLGRFQQHAGFAIPVDDTFKKTIETLKAGKKAEFGFLGIRPEDLTPEERRSGRRGAQVFEVVEGTPAARARLEDGDVITHVNGRPIDNANDLMRDLGRLPVEAVVLMTVERRTDFDGPVRTFKAAATLSKKYVFSVRPAYSRIDDPIWRGMRVDFSTAIPSFYKYARYTDPQGCVAVFEVEPDSAAWRAGMRPSNFISHVGSTRVTTPQEFYAAVSAKGGPVRLRLTSDQGGGGTERTISP